LTAPEIGRVTVFAWPEPGSAGPLQFICALQAEKPRQSMNAVI
jgi:hypothetical protein